MLVFPTLCFSIVCLAQNLEYTLKSNYVHCQITCGIPRVFVFAFFFLNKQLAFCYFVTTKSDERVNLGINVCADWLCFGNISVLLENFSSIWTYKHKKNRPFIVICSGTSWHVCEKRILSPKKLLPLSKCHFVLAQKVILWGITT